VSLYLLYRPRYNPESRPPRPWPARRLPLLALEDDELLVVMVAAANRK